MTYDTMNPDNIVEPHPAEEIYSDMSQVIEVVSPSDKISSHCKGRIIKLLERLRDEEVLRVIQQKRKR